MMSGLHIITLVFLVSAVLGTVETECRPKTEQNLVDLITRREWFAQNNVDYMLSLNSPNDNAYLDIGPVSFGESANLNLFISVYPTSIQKSTIFHAYKNGNAQYNFKVVIKDLNTFTITIGTTTFDVAKASRTTSNIDDEDWDGTNPSIQLEKWNHINIDFVNTDATTVAVNIHVNKRNWNKAIIKQANVLNGLRDNAYLGAGWNPTAQDFQDFLVGFVDNFALFGVSSTQTWRKSCRGIPFSIDVDRKYAVQLSIDFNDALVSIGTTTVAITRTEKPEIFWVVAVLKSGAAFVSRTNLDKWFDCQATGDPHGYKRLTTVNSYTRIDNLEDQPAGKVFVRCGGDPGANSNASELEVRTYTRYTYWWRWSVFRLVAIRYIDYVYRINLDEITSGFEHPSIGYITPKLNVPGGVYRKHISSDTWDPIPHTTDQVFNLEPTTGAQYAHYGSRYLVVKLPGFGSVTVNAPDGVLSSCRYMNLYVLLNDDVCPDIKRGRSTCDNDLNVNADPLYRDWLPPPPLPDLPVSNPDPCSPLLVSAEFKNEASNICNRIYPTDANRRSDCMFDACAAGDIEIVLINKPSAECLLNGLNGNSNACKQLVCPNFCSFRGQCDDNLQKCICDPGYVGKDCAQKKSFSCYDLSFGTQKVKVTSQFTPDSQTQTTSTVQEVFFGEHGVEGSALFYTVYSKSGAERLFVVNNHANGPNPGAYKLCINPTVGSLGSAKIIAKANNRVLGKHNTLTPSTNCFQFSWEAYGSGGVIIDLQPSSGQLSLTLTISDKDGLKQVVYASPNGKGDLDVLKVPEIYHSNFKLDLSLCDAEVCSVYDQKCKDCADQPKCGYCVESGRCMLGDKSGPYAGVCQNWRFTFNEDVSRVVTVEYDSSDLVNPDTEVYLTSTSSSGEAGVPVNVYVPTLIRSYASDVLLLFHTHGDLAANAQQIKRNFANVLGPLSSDNLNIGLGFYDAKSSDLGLSLTRVHPNNFFYFTRALEASIGRTSLVNGGQQFALNLASNNQFSVGWRQNSKRFAFITVYGHSTLEKNDILALRDSVLSANFLPVWVIMGDNDASRDFFQKEIIQNSKGIPGLVLTMEHDASNLLSVLRNGISIGSSLPSIVLKETEDFNIHVDFDVLNSQPDTLFISGLYDAGLRAWFRIPMLRGDNNHHVAQVVVPGFGKSIISDVGNTRPIAKDGSFSANEGVTCLQISLIGSSFKNLLPVIFQVTSEPVNGELFEYDSSKTDSLGNKVTVSGTSGTSDGTTSTLCYRPFKRFFHGADSFTFKSFDGCSYSDIATISIEIKNIELNPIAKDTEITFPEKQNKSIPKIFTCIGGDEGETIYVKVKNIIAEAPDFLRPLNTDVLTVNSVLVTNRFEGGHTVPVEANGFEFSVAGSYKFSSIYFFGTYKFQYICVDSTGLSSDTATATVTITQIIDPPVITLLDYTPVEDKWSEIKFSVKDYDVPLSKVSISQISALDLYTISSTIDGNSPLTLPFDCFTGTSSYVATCSFFFKLNLDNKNSCPGGSGNCATSQLLTTVVLKATASDGQASVSSSSENIMLSIYPENDPPTVTKSGSPIVSTPESTPKDFKIILTDPDFDFSSTEITLTNHASFFSVAVTANQKFSDRHEFTVTVTPVSNEYGLSVIQVKGFDGTLYSDSIDVTINVTYVNNPPTCKDTLSKAFIEDIGDFMVLGVNDVDNTVDQLTFRINPNDIPLIPSTITPKYTLHDENGNILDLNNPLPGPRVYVTTAADYFTNVPDVIPFSVTDKHLFDSSVIGNTISCGITITVKPVNDPPTCIQVNQPVNEDTAAVITLTGEQRAYGEQAEGFAAVVSRVPYDISSNNSDQGNFYQYDAKYTTLSNSDFAAIGVKIKNGDTVTDLSGRVIYIPPQDKNSYTNGKLRAKPYFDFYLTDGADSTPCQGNNLIDIQKVNDVPVAWGNPWKGRSDVSYKGIDPLTNFFEKKVGNCFTFCFGIEDTPLPISLGGQDIEYTDTGYLKFKIDTIGCPVGTTIQYTDINSQIITVSTFPVILNQVYEAGIPHVIVFNPAHDTFNAPGPMIHASAVYTERYCSVVYSVIDDLEAVSAPQTIDISIQESNDLPSCLQNGPPAKNSKCEFLTNINEDFQYFFYEVDMYEDEDLWLFLTFNDAEDDIFVPRIMECGVGNGQFKYSKNPNQANFINSDGTINNLTALIAITTTPLTCGPFSAGPIDSLQPSNKTNRKWMVKFTPDPDEFGNLYNKIAFIIQEEIPVGNAPFTQTAFTLVYYYINVLPVNDRPIIHLKNFDNVNTGTTTPANNGVAVQYNTFTGIDVDPVYQVTDVDNIAGVPSMTVELRFEPSDSQTSIIYKDIDDTDKILTTPLRYTGSLSQVNHTLSSIKFKSINTGVSTLKIYLNDNGATGNCLGQNSGGACPQETTLTIKFNAITTNGITGPLSIAAGAGLGAFLIAGLVGAVFAIRKFKNKKNDSWKEFEEDNFKDYAESNPLYQERTRSHSNPLYVSSLESDQEISS